MNEDELRSEINRMYAEADELEARARENHALSQKFFWQAEKSSSAEMSAEEKFDLTFLACDADVESIKFEVQAEKLHQKIYQLELEFYDLKKLPPIGKEYVPSFFINPDTAQSHFDKLSKIAFRDKLFKAHNGSVEAMRLLGDCFFSGIGTFRNLDKARYWYERAAARGDDIAQTKLNDSYGVEIDPFPQFTPASADLPAFDYTPPKKSQPARKKSSTKKKSSTSSLFSSKQKKPPYDGSFGEVDPRLSALYNSENFGREDHTITFKESYASNDYGKKDNTKILGNSYDQDSYIIEVDEEKAEREAEDDDDD